MRLWCVRILECSGNAPFLPAPAPSLTNIANRMFDLYVTTARCYLLSSTDLHMLIFFFFGYLVFSYHPVRIRYHAPGVYVQYNVQEFYYWFVTPAGTVIINIVVALTWRKQKKSTTGCYTSG